MKSGSILLTLVMVLCGTCLRAEHPLNILKEEARIPMRDGITLGATLYRPADSGRHAAIVFRTPYSKDDYDANAEFPRKAAKAGYVIFLVDVRGRYTSEGKFEAYRNEKKDGYDVIEWVGKSKYCDGNVGTYGQSYPGYVQWLALSQAPPSLKTAAPAMTPIHSHQFFYVGGAFSYSWFDWFMPLILPDLRRKANDPSGPWDTDSADAQWRKEKMSWYRYRPLGSNPLLKKYAPYYYDWLKHQERSGYWEFADVENDFPKMKVPVLLVSGWYDSAYGPLGATDGFNRMRKEGGSPEARQQTRLVLGPWPHSSQHIKNTKFGIVDFGPAAGLDYDSYLLGWFDQHLKEAHKEVAAIPPVSIFVMSANRWRYENEWPLSRAIQTSFYLQSTGDAAKDKTAGALSLKFSDSRADSYIFDPENPLWDIAYEKSFPYDQKDIESRKDVLIYTSEPLVKDIEVTGQIMADLHVSSTARDTDFAITLCDVDANGTSINLAGMDAGYLRMRFRNGFQKAELMKPGNIYPIRIDNLYTSNLFQKGHRIRLQITSSKAPHYDPNPNTGTDFYSEQKLQPATQTIYHDRAHRSRLILPVIENETD